MVEFIGELVFEIVMWPIMSLFGAIAAVLMPSDDPDVRRQQRVCRCTLLAAVSAVIVTVVLYQFASGRHVLMSLGVAFILFIASGFLGNRIEKRCKKEQ